MSAPASRADWTAQGRRFAASSPAPAAREEARLRAFAAARRHSRLVRFLRVAAPVGLVVGVAALIAGALVHPFRAKMGDLSIGAVSVEGSKITMGRPKLTGFRRDGSGYVVNAAKAIQDVTRPTLVELRDVDGDLGMADQTSLHITAAVGLYDSADQSLHLSQDVRIHNPNYDVKLVSANIDFKAGVYRSDEPVTVVMANGGTISADSALARDDGHELTFSGHVRSTFPSEAGGEPARAEMKGTNP
jgi:lipopolysaccharide export system protein LptC